MNVNSKRLSEQLSGELRNRILEVYRASDPLRTPGRQGIKDEERRVSFAKVRSKKQDVTITLKLTQDEAAVIRAYARLCGESMPDLIRKSLIREATLADGYGADDPQYEYGIDLPDDNSLSLSISTKTTYSNQRQTLEDAYNHIRSILGWGKIKF